MKKIFLLILAVVTIAFNVKAQSVNIPDANFKAYLLNNSLINTDNNLLEISVVEANAFTGAILCNGLSILSLTGIEEFTGIQTLNCSDNPLINTFLDVSANTALNRLTSHNSQLTAIDISTNTALEYLDLHGNDLTNIDVTTNIILKNIDLDNNNNLTSINVSNNIALTALSLANAYQLGSINVLSNINLEYLNVYNTGLTSLDVSANIGLLSLQCPLNQLTTLDVSTNVLLDWFTCFGNQLTSLDISDNSILRVLDVSGNQLTSLDVSDNPILGLLDVSENQLRSLDVSVNTVLVTLHCDFNQLSSLDLSNNIYLSRVILNDNQLTSLNVVNGFNQDILDFRITNNPNLLCVQVDNPTYNNNSLIWSLKDSQTYYSLNCNPSSCIVTIPDTNFKSYLVNNSLINTNGDTEIQCSEAAAFTGGIICPNNNISDLTGIEAFIKIRVLNCSGNLLNNLDVSFNTDLENLNCWSNLLGVLDISTNINLRILNCGKNQLSNLNILTNSSLEKVSCNENQLSSIDISGNTGLEYLNCKLNQLTTLDVSNNTVLDFLNCSNNQIEDLDVSFNTNLRYFRSNNNNLKNLNLANTNNTNVYSFDIRNNSNLTCVQIDPSTITSTNTIWLNKDSQHTYSSIACPVIPLASLSLSVLKNVTVYPNPVQGILYFKTTEVEISKIEILDFLGNVLIKAVNIKEGIDVSVLKPGIYSVRIYSEENFILFSNYCNNLYLCVTN